MRTWIPSFLDELTKVAVALTAKEKRRQMAQFTLLGALSGPVIGATVNTIQRGNPLPSGVKSIPRWVAGTMAGGALVSGAIPAVRHTLERNIQQDAAARLRKQKRREELRESRKS